MDNLLDVSKSSESESESDSESEEVFSNFSRSQLEESLSEILERYQKLRVINKNLKKDLVSDSEETKKLRSENSELKETISKLEDKLQKAQKETVSEVPRNTDAIIKECDHIFKKFLAKNIDRSKMA